MMFCPWLRPCVCQHDRVSSCVQNIMLKDREHDDIKIIDFGLAKKMQGGKVR
jgi:hypothetical protein